MSHRYAGVTKRRPRLSEELKRKACKKKSSHYTQGKDDDLYVIKIQNNYVSKVDIWYDYLPNGKGLIPHSTYLGHEVKARHIRHAHIFDSLKEAEFIHKESGGTILKINLEEIKW